MGSSDSSTLLSGEAVADQAEFEKRVAGSAAEPTWFLIRLILYYLFDDLDMALQMYNKLQEGQRKQVSGTHFVDHLEILYSGLLMFRLSNEEKVYSTSKVHKYRRSAKKHLQALDKLVKQGAINCHVMLVMLQAEEAASSFAGNISNAEQHEKRFLCPRYEELFRHHMCLLI